jgi:hypothetical protein
MAIKNLASVEIKLGRIVINQHWLNFYGPTICNAKPFRVPLMTSSCVEHRGKELIRYT